jgi:hypothetical protein
MELPGKLNSMAAGAKAPAVFRCDVALFTAQRNATCLRLHLESGHGGGKITSRQLGDLPQADRFTPDTAAKTGER